ncbi:MAG TPA: FGGY family carbohydrate kinase [Acidiferrobacterales bacterium]
MASADAPASDALYLALDQGGHASRALVFDARGRPRARGLREVAVTRPGEDRVEQDPEELVDSLRAAIADAYAGLGADARRVRAAGLATQRSSIVCWDSRDGRALSPVLSWQDRRAHAWIERFAPHGDDIHRRTGLYPNAHYGASKLRWCLDHLPAVRAAAAAGDLAFGPLASFLVQRLLDERPLLADPANAARTLLWNLGTRDWDAALLALFDIPRAALPRCVPTRHAYGTLATPAGGLPLQLLTGDQSAALFANGTPRADVAYINIGTGAFVQRITGAVPRQAPRLLTGIVFQDGESAVHVLEGTVNGAGSALAWWRERRGIGDIEARLPGWLDQEHDPPLFLNGVSGLGSPFWRAQFTPRFVGAAPSPAGEAAAIVESVVFLLQANLEAMAAALDRPSRLQAGGGLAQLDGLCQRLADLSGLAVHRPAEQEATARGTAFLVAGQPADWPALAPGRDFRPRANPALRERCARWRQALDTALSSGD